MTKRLVNVWLNPSARNTIKGVAALKGKTIVEYLDEIAEKERRNLKDEEELRRRKDIGFF